jgi:hypothetical protein
MPNIAQLSTIAGYAAQWTRHKTTVQ